MRIDPVEEERVLHWIANVVRRFQQRDSDHVEPKRQRVRGGARGRDDDDDDDGDIVFMGPPQ